MSLDLPHARLRLEHWDRVADPADLAILSRCVGPTLDVGCGPGRLTAALAETGHVVLGIDVLGGAVGQARDRGAAALHRDVFEAVPGEGRWGTALLADGNIGIGGDPAALLRRLRELVDPRGRVVAELAAPGTGVRDGIATLEWGRHEQSVRWSVVGVDAIDELAHASGLAVVECWEIGQRWVVVLQEDVA